MKRVEVKYSEGADASSFEGVMTDDEWLNCLMELRLCGPEDLVHLPYNTADAWIIRRHIIAVGVVDNG